MQDLYATEIGIEAELEYRRRQFSTLRRSSLEPPPRKTFRVIVAEALAHLALHLDGSAIGSVTDRHTPHPSAITHRPQGGAV
jgi:hypothetical protein